MRGRLLLPLLALLLLPACAEVQKTADRATDCVGLARDVASSGLSRTPTLEEAEQAAQRLDERIETLDDAQVREAATSLRDRLGELRDAVASADPAATQQAGEAAREAARVTADACGLPLDRFLA